MGWWSFNASMAEKALKKLSNEDVPHLLEEFHRNVLIYVFIIRMEIMRFKITLKFLARRQNTPQQTVMKWMRSWLFQWANSVHRRQCFEECCNYLVSYVCISRLAAHLRILCWISKASNAWWYYESTSNSSWWSLRKLRHPLRKLRPSVQERHQQRFHFGNCH